MGEARDKAKAFAREGMGLAAALLAEAAWGLQGLADHARATANRFAAEPEADVPLEDLDDETLIGPTRQPEIGPAARAMLDEIEPPRPAPKRRPEPLKGSLQERMHRASRG